VAAMFVNELGWNVLMNWDEMSNLNRELPIDASYWVLVHFGQTVSEQKNFKNQPIRNKSRLWWPCLLSDQDEMSHLYREPSIDASFHVLVYLAKWFQRRRLKKISQSETRISCGRHVC
jgi:hypothetical protein